MCFEINGLKNLKLAILRFLHIIIIIISLFKVDKHTKIDVNLEHREHLATTQNNKKKA